MGTRMTRTLSFETPGREVVPVKLLLMYCIIPMEVHRLYLVDEAPSSVTANQIKNLREGPFEANHEYHSLQRPTASGT